MNPATKFPVSRIFRIRPEPDAALEDQYGLHAHGADAWNYDVNVLYFSVRYQL